jgi:pyrimidine-nucleoside phosphorylase
MNIYEIISRKRDGHSLLADEIDFAVRNYTDGIIPDYQMSALLMAIFIRGMDEKETTALCLSMTASGKIIGLGSLKLPKIDKHSTGGVGDGTSLVVAPLCAACGIVVPMMSGRTLGHTGGTLDKLEAIPGFNVNLTESMYRKQLEKIGVAMIGQTEDVAPADKKLYALRDVTATVDSIPLIAASIMSKKIAEGSDGIVLDVKTGNGAFMKDLDNARELARTMVNLGKAAGMKTKALITDMSQPLGFAVGNALEVKQAIETMRGAGPKDFTELCVELSARMLVLAKTENNLNTAKQRMRASFCDGSALEKFKAIIEHQGGNARVIDEPEKILPKAKKKEEICSLKSGYVSSFDTRAVGLAAVHIGAGRKIKTDRIDPSAGFVLCKKTGDRVEKGEPLAVMYHSGGAKASEAKKMFLGAVKISAIKPAISKFVYEEI